MKGTNILESVHGLDEYPLLQTWEKMRGFTGKLKPFSRFDDFASKAFVKGILDKNLILDVEFFHHFFPDLYLLLLKYLPLSFGFGWEKVRRQSDEPQTV